MMVNLSETSSTLGKKACCYLTDITDWLKRNNLPGLPQNYGSKPEKTILIVGGWSKTNYLPEVDAFAPVSKTLYKMWNRLKLVQSDMVTKKPLLYDDSIYVLGRNHIHILDLKEFKAEISSNQGENQALVVA